LHAGASRQCQQACPADFLQRARSERFGLLALASRQEPLDRIAALVA
jgi:hypothetical protein